MTSKEALTEIKDHIESPTWWKNHFKKIEQDLERLEQLEYVMLLIVSYGMIDTERLEDANWEEIEAIQKVCNEVEDRWRGV